MMANTKEWRRKNQNRETSHEMNSRKRKRPSDEIAQALSMMRL